MRLFTPYPIKRIEKINLKEGQSYFRFGSRETSLCRDEIWISWIVNQGTESFLDLPNGKVYDYYIEEKSSLKLFGSLIKYMEENWPEHLSNYPLKKEGLIKSAKKLSEITTTKNNQLILQSFLDYLRKAYDFCEYIWTPWAVIYLLEEQVVKKFPKGIDLIFSLDEPIEFFKMKRELFKLTPEELIKKYGWLNVYSPFDSPYTKSDFEKLKKETKPEEIEEAFNKFEENKIKFSQFKESIRDEQDKKKVEIVHKYAFLKTDRIDAWKKAMFYLREFYNYLIKLIPELTLQDACNLANKEIINLLEQGIIPTEEVKLRSANQALYYFHKGGIEILTEEKKIKEILNFLEEKEKKLEKVKGIVACRGKAQGKVKVINHSEDLSKIEKGDIFVAKYTFPSFTPYMAKCRAIVIDEGGLTSHAAVISRELNLPCLVNTQIATKVLKDGDLVEVDAEKGMVKKIK